MSGIFLQNQPNAGPGRGLTEQLQKSLRKKWPGAVRSLTDRDDLFFATGLAAFDRLFASGRGLPYGQLIEIRGGVSSGKTSLLFSILAGAASRRKRIAYVDFNNSFFPDATDASGIDLSRLLLIKPSTQEEGRQPRQLPRRPAPPQHQSPDNTIDDIKDGLRTAELLFRDRHADIIVFDLVDRRTLLPIGLLHRLRLKTVRAKGLVIFLTEVTPSRMIEIIPSSMTSLRLEVRRIDGAEPNHLQVTVTKSRLCPEGIRLEVRL